MRARRVGAALALAILGLAAAATAQHLTVSLAAGGFSPSDATYRQIYGNGMVIAGDAWLAFEKHFGLAFGFGRLSDDGLAVPVSGGAASFPLSFTRTTVPLLFFYELGSKAVTVRLGAGAGFHSYRESWQTVDLEFSDSKVGPRLVLAVSAAIFRRLSLYASATYDSIPTGAGAALATDIDLGGFQVLGGLAYRIFQEDP
jgi:hypothetical protein